MQQSQSDNEVARLAEAISKCRQFLGISWHDPRFRDIRDEMCEDWLLAERIIGEGLSFLFETPEERAALASTIAEVAERHAAIAKRVHALRMECGGKHGVSQSERDWHAAKAQLYPDGALV